MKVYKSEIPSSCQNGQAVCLGIDEAGRGPVLGPMVYGAAYWPLEREKEMEDSSFDDSKALSPEQRKSLFENIKNHPHVGYIILEIPPEEISSKMLRKIPYNLNAISHDTAIGLVEKALEDNVQVEKVYVDTVGDPSRYEVSIEEYCATCFLAHHLSLMKVVFLLMNACRKNWMNISEERLSLPCARRPTHCTNA
eukprot:gb/GECG01011328.1/.p1 GENE.gb/GECG01011328.1/~~gb/GECG01011328.1/.p1  ORF type:complete len:195 (+),score=23.95 gb/GECG01011328.1/:1-585(+)